MKVIDLLEEKPYMFIWKDNIYELVDNEYIRTKDNWKPYFYLEQLDEEIEVIEEDKNIERLKCNSKYTRNQRKIINKINEIIDKINEGE